VSEFLDSRTTHLLEGVDDVGCVLGNKIVSAVIAQVAENRYMNQVSSSPLPAPHSSQAVPLSPVDLQQYP